MRTTIDPVEFAPRAPEELIGPASPIAAALVARARRLRERPSAPLKLLLWGPPGVGKSTIAGMIAAELTGGCAVEVEAFSGKEVTIDTVKAWMPGLAFRSLFARWSVKIVDELDRCSRDAQDLLLAYLDRMPPGRALVATSNQDLGQIGERVQTRFQTIKIEAPEPDQLEQWLRIRWRVGGDAAGRIALGSAGCVRAALLDLQNLLDSSISIQPSAKKGARSHARR